VVLTARAVVVVSLATTTSRSASISFLFLSFVVVSEGINKRGRNFVPFSEERPPQLTGKKASSRLCEYIILCVIKNALSLSR
jgi:hypothetical protein